MNGQYNLQSLFGPIPVVPSTGLLPIRPQYETVMREWAAAKVPVKVDWKSIADPSNRKAYETKYKWIDDYNAFSPTYLVGRGLMGWGRDGAGGKFKRETDAFLAKSVRPDQLTYSETPEGPKVVHGPIPVTMNLQASELQDLSERLTKGGLPQQPAKWTKGAGSTQLAWQIDNYIPDLDKFLTELDSKGLNYKGDFAKTLTGPSMTERNKYIKIRLKLARSEVSAGDMSGPSGQLPQNFTVTLTWEVFSEIVYPWEYVLWAQGATKMDDYVPYLNIMHVMRSLRWYMGADSEEKGPGPYQGRPTDIERRVQALKDRGLQPRVNDDGYTILSPSGTVLYCPTEDRINEYEAALRGAVGDDGKIHNLPETIAGKNIMTDWTHGLITMAKVDGTLKKFNLTGSKPLDDVTIGLWMHRLISGQTKNMAVFFRYCPEQFPSSVKDAWDKATADDATVPTWGDIIDPEQAHNDGIKLACEDIKSAFLALHRKWGEVGTNVPSESAYQMRFFIDLIAAYGPRQTQFNKAYQDAVAANETPPVPNLKSVSKVPNCPALDGLMLHQERGAQAIERGTQGAMLDMAPGSGKTITAIAAAMRLKMNMGYKRTLIVTQNNLVPEFIKEINAVSDGRINGYPLTKRVMARYIEGGMDEQKFEQEIQGIANNTLFITSYTSLNARSERINYLGRATRYFPFAIMLARIGFDLVFLDESQNVKNEESLRSEAVGIVTCLAKKVVPMSGTQIHNDPSDLPGQMAKINPSSLGNERMFKATFAKEMKGNTVTEWDPNLSQRLQRAMVPFSCRNYVKRRDFAFLMPPASQSFYKVDSMTAKQTEVYKTYLDNTVNDIKNNPDLVRRLKGKSKEEQDSIMEHELKRALEPLEVFLNAPGKFAPFAIANEGNAKELQGPKSVAVNNLLSDYLFGGNAAGDPTIPHPGKHKVVVFCYHKDVGDHIWDYLPPKIKNLCLRYTAGDQDAITAFRDLEDPHRVLIANEKSLQAGYNFQFADFLIRVESLWTPGDLDQAYARIARPQPPGKNRKIIPRDKIYMRWLFTDHSFDVAKTCRLISKIIVKARVEEYSNPDFKEVEHKLDQLSLPALSMNLDVLEAYHDWNTHEGTFVGAMRDVNTWEDKQFDVSRRRLADKVFNETGEKVDPAQAPDKAMLEVKSDMLVPGSAHVYVPWVAGAPPPDPVGHGWRPMSVLVETEEDEDTGEETEVLNVQPATAVMTEFGPGRFVRATRNSAVCDVVGVGRVSLPTSVVYVATQKEALFDKSLKTVQPMQVPNIIKAAMGIDKSPVDPRLTGIGAPTPAGERKLREDDDEPPARPAENVSAELLYIRINNAPALFVIDPDEDAGELLARNGFHKTHPAVHVELKNPTAGRRFAEAIDKAEQRGRITMTPQDRQHIADALTLYKQTGGHLLEAKARSRTQSLKDFYAVTQHRESKDPLRIRPYMMAVEDTLTFAVDYNTQPKGAQAVLNLKGKLGGGIDVYKVPAEYFRFVNGKGEAKEVIKKLIAKNFRIRNPKQLERDLGISTL